METTLQLSTFMGRALHLVLPFMTGLCAILGLALLAPSLGIVDRPDARKIHEGDVPLVGGPAMFVAIAMASALLLPHPQILVFLVLCAALVAMGMADDVFDLSPVLRAVVQAGVAFAMVAFTGAELTNLGDLVGLGPVALGGLVALGFTVLCTVGVINAVNMIDGVDGLVGSVLTISFAALAWVSWSAGHWIDTKLAVIVLGALASFLLFNARVFVPRARIFMGDSGSMMLGFALAWLLVRLTQGPEAALSPVAAGWVFGLPLMDTVSVLVARVRRRVSPMTAGRDHLHHLLLDAGFSVNRTVATLCLIQAAFVSVGLIGGEIPGAEPALFAGFVALTVVHHALTSRRLRTRIGALPDPVGPGPAEVAPVSSTARY